MTNATLQREAISREKAEGYEHWVQSVFESDPRLTVLQILYNDLANGCVTSETWDYFDAQDMSGAAENLKTRHTTLVEGEYNPDDDEIIAAVAGGERITYDSFMANGLKKAQERMARDPGFSFQLERDQIFFENYHGPIKEMWRTETDYDTVFYVSTFADDIFVSPSGAAKLQELWYDAKEKKGFIYAFKKLPNHRMEFAATRVANADRSGFAPFLAAHGRSVDPDAPSSSFGAQIIRESTGGKSLKDVMAEKAAIFDAGLHAQTGKSHEFGQCVEDGQRTIDAYDLFEKTPHVWQAYREYHLLLAKHFRGALLDDSLHAFLQQTFIGQANHVLEAAEKSRLEAQLRAGRITVDMALACKKLMTYAHYATLNKLHDEYVATGKVGDSDQEDLLRSYGDAASSNGGNAAAAGESFGDCENGYGANATQAAQFAQDQGISLEEAMRQLGMQTDQIWKLGTCLNCERKRSVGGCSICKTCADAHTARGDAGLKSEREKAITEKLALEKAEIAKRALGNEALKVAQPPRPKTGAIIMGDDGKKKKYIETMIIGGTRGEWVNV